MAIICNNIWVRLFFLVYERLMLIARVFIRLARRLDVKKCYYVNDCCLAYMFMLAIFPLRL